MPWGMDRPEVKASALFLCPWMIIWMQYEVINRFSDIVGSQKLQKLIKVLISQIGRKF